MKEIELVKKDGVYVQKNARVVKASAKKTRKAQPLAERPQIDASKIVTDFTIDFFRLIRKEMFK